MKDIINPFALMKAICLQQRKREMWVTIQYANGTSETRALTITAWRKLPKVELPGNVELDGMAKWAQGHRG